MASSIASLDAHGLAEGVKYLCEREPVFDAIVKKYGPPPLWAREPGFPTLVHIILEQQVSLASARACFDKLLIRLPTLTPEHFLGLADEALLDIGYSRQKTRYTRNLAQKIFDGHLKLDDFNQMEDEKVFKKLVSLTGIGPWTANIYLLMALRRPDIWPAGDLALVVAIQALFRLDARPTADEFQSFSEKWRPYRAVAARILWHYYLSAKEKQTI
ncbi:MAG: DNA-3-methyladenine glycosylase 2 family protein [Candidatus Marinimicrobia bacterium]|nr:DNA-3-methyladenine glycosylase 2 family protein [Candidatus Neomarinimicrobiota bacterium]